jgi:uncharacterized membrane protein
MDSTGWAVSAVLLAQGVKFQFLWATLALVGALLAAAMIFALLDRWRKRSTTQGLSAGDQLTHFRKLYDQGTISKEEYERIRTQLSEDLRKEMKVEPQAEAAPARNAPDVMTLPQPPKDEPPPAP